MTAAVVKLFYNSYEPETGERRWGRHGADITLYARDGPDTLTP